MAGLGQLSRAVMEVVAAREAPLLLGTFSRLTAEEMEPVDNLLLVLAASRLLALY